MEEQQVLQHESNQAQSAWRVFPLLLWAAATLLIALLAYVLGARQSSGPGEASAEVGFARDMITHHAQAVDMATLLRDRTDDPVMRQIALDMLLTQQAQIGQMQGWLNTWGYPIAGTEPAMAWMGMPTTGQMPGMASPQEINQLRDLTGVEADSLFLRLMIVHHRSAVRMAGAVLEQTQEPMVRALAQSIFNSQTSEIELMEDLLRQKDGSMPAEDGMDMEHP